MNIFKRIIKYCLLSMIIATIYYYALTTSGYKKIYNLIIKIASIDIEEMETLLEDEKISEEISKAKIILVAKTGNREADLVIAMNMIEIADRIKQAEIWVEQIPNSEADYLNRYLENANEIYLDDKYYRVLDDNNENYKKIASRLYESSIVRNKNYSFAGIEKERNLQQQAENIRMLIDETKNNSIHKDIEAILYNTNITEEEFLEKIVASVEENESMYKEHFLTKYKELTEAIRAYKAYKEENYSIADAFCDLYRDTPTSTIITFLEGDEIESFIKNISDQAAIFDKRHVLIEAFDYTEDKSEEVSVRIIDTEKMKLADAYGKFVYRLSGKDFQPTPRETGRYYIRIENEER